MKPVIIPRLAIWLCLTLLWRYPSLRAAESSPESPAYDAVAAAPDNHRVVFENEKVRVLEVTIKPGEKEPFHEHPLFSVMNIIRGAPLRITQATLQDGKIVTAKQSKSAKTIFNLRHFGCLPRDYTPRRMSEQLYSSSIASNSKEAEIQRHKNIRIAIILIRKS